MSVSVIKKPTIIRTEIVTGTTGDTQYSGLYYVDITPTGNLTDMIGLTVISTTSNRPAYAQRRGGMIRVFSPVATTDVSVLISYK